MRCCIRVPSAKALSAHASTLIPPCVSRSALPPYRLAYPPSQSTFAPNLCACILAYGAKEGKNCHGTLPYRRQPCIDYSPSEASVRLAFLPELCLDLSGPQRTSVVASRYASGGYAQYQNSATRPRHGHGLMEDPGIGMVPFSGQLGKTSARQSADAKALVQMFKAQIETLASSTWPNPFSSRLLECRQNHQWLFWSHVGEW
ncbi:hypothetical protein B0T17DRAFT_285362 [Bombardia bombarda]|uniref:Uncharacterized protein n=1 Tax=Bombardia bombarda TaxID=252184 RepID=A0AA39WTJ5_9PEZI|nr:hypothetical protein B0T17DRAFT_285362 [Bombardia bombarda]